VTGISASSAPLVSVVLNTYNRADLVPQSINSVLSQDYPNFEVIVVDDGSTDNTREVIEEQFGDRVRYIHQENAGLAAGRNTGIKAARGEYIAFQDDDDLWLPGKLSRQVAALEAKRDCTFVYGVAMEMTPDGCETGNVYGNSMRGTSGDNFEAMLRHHPILGPTLLVRRAWFERAGLFDPDLRTAEDTDLFLRLTLREKGVYLREPLVLVRQHPGRKTRSERADGTMLRATRVVYARLMESLPPERSALRGLIHFTLLSVKLRLAEAFTPDADWEEVQRELTRLMRRHGLALSDFAAHEVLAHVALASGRRSDHRARIDAIASIAEEVAREARIGARRCRSLFYCAVARRSFAQGRVGVGARYAALAAVTHPGAFARYLLPTLPRAFLWMARRLARRGDPTGARSPANGHDGLVEGRLPNHE